MKLVLKILSLGIIFLFLCTVQLSAQKCKFKYEKKDPITGEVTKGTKFVVEAQWMITSKPFHRFIGISRIGDTYFIEIEIMVAGNAREFISIGDPFVVKLANDETITAYSQAEFRPTQQANQNLIYSTYIAKYEIDELSLQKMAKSPPTFYRLNIEAKTYDKNLSGPVQKQLSQAAKCILQ